MTDHKKHDKEAEEAIIKKVEEYGWYVPLFPATAYLPSFAYTIGLWKNFNHPELIAFGLSTDTLHAVLNFGGEIVKAGGKLVPNSRYTDFFENSEAYIIEVDERNIRDYFGYGIWYNKEPFKALQIVWTDRNEKFPWENDFEEQFLYKQPLLDRNFEFKFSEPKSLAVFTNRHHLELNKPILYVVHDYEGDWQFVTDDDISDEDARLISLEELIKRDRSLNDLFNLDYGQYAERKSVNDAWVRGKLEEND